ncbi:Sodium channel subunit beta-4 [Merluccius polli]|uniref:Sodium channel subunit beta-4 n=1 Tax=Merluccius polli TaxID=89951 RepID=A0AA47P597_MERPO|nr:Sodium channel subunit beta-4 [Merluccius polli]
MRPFSEVFLNHNVVFGDRHAPLSMGDQREIVTRDLQFSKDKDVHSVLLAHGVEKNAGLVPFKFSFLISRWSIYVGSKKAYVSNILFPLFVLTCILFPGPNTSTGVWCVDGLEVSTAKVSFLEATNGSTVLLPCTYSSCIGIKNLYFNWHYNDNGTMLKLCEAVIPKENVEPSVNVYHERVEFVGSSKKNNISILLWNITFEDGGEYVCFARNPKEKNRNHSAIYTLIVVDQLKEIDNTLTTIIVSIVGMLIGCLVTFMVVKALIVNFMPKKEDKKNPYMLYTMDFLMHVHGKKSTGCFRGTHSTPATQRLFPCPRWDSNRCLTTQKNRLQRDTDKYNHNYIIQ